MSNLISAASSVSASAVTADKIVAGLSAGISSVAPAAVADKFDVSSVGGIVSKINFRKDKDGNKPFENALAFYPALPDLQSIVNELGPDLLAKIINDLIISKYDEIARAKIEEVSSIDLSFADIFIDAISGIKTDYSGSTGRKSAMPSNEEIEELFKDNFVNGLVAVISSKGITDPVKVSGILNVYLELLKALFSRKGSSLTDANFDQLIKMTQFDGVAATAQVLILERIKGIQEAKAKKNTVAAADIL